METLNGSRKYQKEVSERQERAARRSPRGCPAPIDDETTSPRRFLPALAIAAHTPRMPMLVWLESGCGRERVLLVRSGEHEYLLGVTPSQVQLLDKRAHTAHAHATSPSQPLSTVTD